MKKVTVEYEVFKYPELNDKAKEEVKRWWLEGQDPEDFTEMCVEDLKNLFPNSDLKVQYSLNSCQGDGLNIYGSLNVKDCLNLLENHNAGDTFDKYYILSEKEKRTVLHYLDFTDECIPLPENRYYCYSLAYRIEVKDFYWDLLEENYIRDINFPLLEKLQHIIRGMMMKLAKVYEQWGYDFFYEISDEDLAEVCDANEYEFLNDGTLWTS